MVTGYHKEADLTPRLLLRPFLPFCKSLSLPFPCPSFKAQLYWGLFWEALCDFHN